LSEARHQRQYYYRREAVHHIHSETRRREKMMINGFYLKMAEGLGAHQDTKGALARQRE
jgi:hypothetical protein